MRRHRRGQQRKRGYLHARNLGRRLDDEAMALGIARDIGLIPADDAEPANSTPTDSEETPA
jgi:hypothetical protein